MDTVKGEGGGEIGAGAASMAFLCQATLARTGGT
jgi:hypothetical protein